MGNMNAKPAVILLADDDSGDQELTRRAFKKSLIKNELFVVNNGQAALDYLLRKGIYSDPLNSPTPDLFLLDLNMPKMDGRQVIEEIKKHPELALLTIVVLSTSKEEEDVICTYKLGINSFITKPIDFAEFIRIIQAICHYWFEIVALPPQRKDH